MPACLHQILTTSPPLILLKLALLIIDILKFCHALMIYEPIIRVGLNSSLPMTRFVFRYMSQARSQVLLVSSVCILVYFRNVFKGGNLGTRVASFWFDARQHETRAHFNLVSSTDPHALFSFCLACRESMSRMEVWYCYRDDKLVQDRL